MNHGTAANLANAYLFVNDFSDIGREQNELNDQNTSQSSRVTSSQPLMPNPLQVRQLCVLLEREVQLGMFSSISLTPWLRHTNRGCRCGYPAPLLRTATPKREVFQLSKVDAAQSDKLFNLSWDSTYGHCLMSCTPICPALARERLRGCVFSFTDDFRWNGNYSQACRARMF